jgi:hypothetical protein
MFSIPVYVWGLRFFTFFFTKRLGISLFRPLLCLSLPSVSSYLFCNLLCKFYFLFRSVGYIRSSRMFFHFLFFFSFFLMFFWFREELPTSALFSFLFPIRFIASLHSSWKLQLSRLCFRPLPILHCPRLFFLILVCEAIGTAATPGLLCQPRVIVKVMVEKQMECRLVGETEVLGENLPQRHFCPSQNPTWPDSGLNPGRRGGKPVTNRLSYGAAIF